MSHPESATLPISEQREGSEALAKRFSDIISREELRLTERDALFAELLDRPAETLVVEVHTLLEKYKDRAVSYDDEHGESVVRFATRNTQDPEAPRIDDDYAIYTDNDGNITYSVKIMPYENLGYSFLIKGDRMRLNVVTGSYNVPIRPDGVGQYGDALKDIVRRTLDTARIVHQRREGNPQEAERADEDARELLAARILAQHPSVEIKAYDALHALAA